MSYAVEIIWTQDNGGISRWKYEGEPYELARQLRILADDIEWQYSPGARAVGE